MTELRQRDWPAFDLLPDWHDEAACKGFPSSWWFPNQGGQATEAKRICWSCPVRRECLSYAITTPQQKFGIWGGYTESQRRRVRKERVA